MDSSASLPATKQGGPVVMEPAEKGTELRGPGGTTRSLDPAVIEGNLNGNFISVSQANRAPFPAYASSSWTFPDLELKEMSGIQHPVQ